VPLADAVRNPTRDVVRAVFLGGLIIKP
jgi:hypothetical protein